MRRDQLEHLIRAVCDVIDAKSVVIVGSQAIHGSLLSDIPQRALDSDEADFLPYNDTREGAIADVISASLGVASHFRDTFGVYADGVSRDTARFPGGWLKRLVPISSAATAGCVGRCPEIHDLAISKLLAWSPSARPHDREFVEALHRAGHLDLDLLRRRLDVTEVSPRERETVLAVIHGMATRGVAPPARDVAL